MVREKSYTITRNKCNIDVVLSFNKSAFLQFSFDSRISVSGSKLSIQDVKDKVKTGSNF